MKKQTITTVFIGLIMMVSLAFMGCNNVMSPSSSPSVTNGTGTGTVTVSFSASAGKAALSPKEMNFDLYEFTFTRTSDGYSFVTDRTLTQGFTFSLDMGANYTLSVKAYKGTKEAGVVAAQGSSAPFSVGASTPVLVKLSGVLTGGGEGTFWYSVNYPAGTQIEELVLLIDENNSHNLNSGAGSEGVSGSVITDAGWYFLIVRLSKDGKTAGYANGVVIYPGQTTSYEVTFEEVNFKVTSDEQGNTGVRVTDWRGFNVEGASPYWNNDRTSANFNEYYFYDYDRSRAVGTLYQAPFKDPAGNVWQEEVLKLEPPAEKDASQYDPRFYIPGTPGYAHWTVTMTRLLEGGKYKLSMKVWVKESNESVQIAWFDTNTWNSLQAAIAGSAFGNVNRNEWLDIEGVFTTTNNAETDICLMARYYPNDCGLRDATIYIRDLKLEPYVEPFKITPASFSVMETKTRTLSANREVSGWESSNGAVATVSSSGVVTAHSVGTATIKAYSNDSSPQTATSMVTVTEKGVRYIALSFDDGPDPVHTHTALDILEQYGARATFFPIANTARTYWEASSAVINRGHEIGNHTLYHDTGLFNGSLSNARNTLIQAQIAAEKGSGKMPTLFRAPGLQYRSDHASYPYDEVQYTTSLTEAARSLGLPIIDASGHQHGNFDWYQPSAEAIVEHIKTLARDWGILLIHDGRDNRDEIAVQRTIEALPGILDWLINEEGFTVVGVHELAAIRGIELEPGKIYYDFSEGTQAIRVTGIEFAQSEITLNDLGATQQLNAVVTPGNAPALKYWYSDDDNVATVDANGLVTAVGYGITNITVIAGSQYAKVKVTVEKEPVVVGPIETKTTWDAFDVAGGGRNAHPWYVGAEAIGEVLPDFTPGDGYSYGNVLQVSPPSGGYYYENPGRGSLAMVFKVPVPGVYTLTYDVWVESERNDVNLVWYSCGTYYGSWPELNDDGVDTQATPVQTGKWITRTGSQYIYDAGIPFGLFCRNANMTSGLKDATVYFKNLTLELESAENLIINIPGTETLLPSEPGNPVIILEWENNGINLTAEVSSGALVSQNPLTVRKGGKVAITAPVDYGSYEWRIGAKMVGIERTFVFIAENAGDYEIRLMTNNPQNGASILIRVVE